MAFVCNGDVCVALRRVLWPASLLALLATGCSPASKPESSEVEATIKTPSSAQVPSKVEERHKTPSSSQVPRKVELIVFSAKWCAVCRKVPPVLENLRSKFPEVSVRELDVDDEKNGKLAADYDADALPYYFVLVDGKVAARYRGFLPYKDAEKFLHEELGKLDSPPAVKDDPNANMDTPEEKAAAYAALNKSIRDKLLGVGQKRSIHWIIRFNTEDGRNYLRQLASLKAVVIVPLPPNNKQAYIFRDLNDPKPGTFCSDADWEEIKDKMQFSDDKKDSVDGFRRALGMDVVPNEFWAFFSKDVEEEMAGLEKNYRNRKPEDIDTTYFRVVLRDGRYVMTVEDQKAYGQR